MGEMIKMVVVLTILSVISGGGLKWLEEFTKPTIEKVVLERKTGPAIRDILKDASNNPVSSNFKLKDGDQEHRFFVGATGGKVDTIVLEAEGKGFADKIGMVVAIDIEKNQLAGLRVTTHKETPGLGGEAKDNPEWATQFSGKSIEAPIKVTNDGGEISAISGATITSRAICDAANIAIERYEKLKPQLLEQMDSAVKE